MDSAVDQVRSTAESIGKGLEITRHSLLTTSGHGQESAMQISMALDTSVQMFQVWAQTWIGKDGVSSEVLWGEKGRTDVQRLLEDVVELINQIKAIALEKSSERAPKKWQRKMSPWTTKTSQNAIARSSDLLRLTGELRKSIDVLWTYSEVAFDSLHGILSKKIISARSENYLLNLLHSKIGSLALYKACYSSGRDCSLDLDLINGSPKSHSSSTARVSISSRTSTNLFYHLVTQSCNAPDDPKSETRTEAKEITIESGLNLEHQNNSVSEPFNLDETDLETFELQYASKPSTIRILSQGEDRMLFFRVTKYTSNNVSTPQYESLAQILNRTKVITPSKLVPPPSLETEVDQLSIKVKVDLAFKLVECGLYLLGTPWLAKLDSNTLKRVEGGKQPFVLKIQTLNVDDLAFDDPDALAESAQLFRIGVILMELALGTPDHEDESMIQDPYLARSRMLPLVHQSMGSQYCKATAFCLQLKDSPLSFGSPDKYMHPEETGWAWYLADLLEEYYAEVFVR